MLANKLVAAQAITKRKWLDFLESGKFEFIPPALESIEDSVFCMGSCFAENIRLALETKGVNCYPNYESLVNLKADRLRIDSIFDQRYHMNYYTPGVIAQELKDSSSYSSDYHYQRSHSFVPSTIWLDQNTKFSGWLDPTRRCCYAEDKEMLLEASKSVSHAIFEGLKKSKLFIITLGLVEQWIYEMNSEEYLFNQFPTYANLYPDKKVLKSLKVEFLEFNDVLQCLTSIVESIRIHNNAPIIFTVSPVPLMRTFRKNMNVFEANMTSKSTLHAAVKEFVNSRHDILYFPSYEMASSIGYAFFEERDYRHPKKEMVELITNSFLSGILG